MKQYRVVWEIDVDADSPREAAKLAWEIQRDVAALPPIFTVDGEDIDLEQEEEE